MRVVDGRIEADKKSDRVEIHEESTMLIPVALCEPRDLQ